MSPFRNRHDIDIFTAICLRCRYIDDSYIFKSNPSMLMSFLSTSESISLFIYLFIKKRIEHVWNGHGADSEIGNVSA